MTYTRAKEALMIAKDKYGMSYRDIAELCDVSLGTVKRWMLVGRADEDKILPLIERIGHQVYLTPSHVADHLEHLYKSGPRENAKGNNVRRFRITNQQLKRIAGRQYLKATFKAELIDELRERGYLLVADDDGFVMVNWKWLYNSSAEISDSELPDFYEVIAEEIDLDEETD